MTNELLKLLKDIHAEIVRSNDIREAFSTIDDEMLELRIKDIRNRREKLESARRQHDAIVAAIAADEKGSLAFPEETASGVKANIKASSILANGVTTSAGSVVADVLPNNAKEPSSDQFQSSGPFPVATGPDLRSARAVLVVAGTADDAVSVVERWSVNLGRTSSIFRVDKKEIRDALTKDVRNDPHVFFNRTDNKIRFIAGDMSMQPDNWLPAFDVIAVVSGDHYTLLKGKRAPVVKQAVAEASASPKPAAEPSTESFVKPADKQSDKPADASPVSIPTPDQLFPPAEKITEFPTANRILKNSLPDISKYKAVMFYGPDIRLTKFFVECIVYRRGAPTIPVVFNTKDDYSQWRALSSALSAKSLAPDTDPFRRRSTETGYQSHVIVGWNGVVDSDLVDVCIRVSTPDGKKMQWEIIIASGWLSKTIGFLEVGPA